MTVVRFIVAVAIALAIRVEAHAQPAPSPSVALLPLDADQRLEIYGQPVASEIARALVAGGVDVVVVGPKMAVPDRARLIVDGTITAKSDAIVITLRVRNRQDGQMLETLTSTAASLVTIDQAASDLSTRLLPSVKHKLDAFAVQASQPRDPKLPIVPPPSPAKLLPMLVAVSPSITSGPTTPLRKAMADAIDGWARAHRREPRRATLEELGPTRAVKAVAGAGTNLGVALEIASFEVTGVVPLARARVRVRVADASRVVFDRVIATDTIVGDKGMPTDQLAQRVVVEVLAILQPHLRRLIGGWP